MERHKLEALSACSDNSWSLSTSFVLPSTAHAHQQSSHLRHSMERAGKSAWGGKNDTLLNLTNVLARCSCLIWAVMDCQTREIPSQWM